MTATSQSVITIMGLGSLKRRFARIEGGFLDSCWRRLPQLLRETDIPSLSLTQCQKAGELGLTRATFLRAINGLPLSGSNLLRLQLAHPPVQRMLDADAKRRHTLTIVSELRKQRIVGFNEPIDSVEVDDDEAAAIDDLQRRVDTPPDCSAGTLDGWLSRQQERFPQATTDQLVSASDWLVARRYLPGYLMRLVNAVGQGLQSDDRATRHAAHRVRKFLPTIQALHHAFASSRGRRGICWPAACELALASLDSDEGRGSSLLANDLQMLIHVLGLDWRDFVQPDVSVGWLVERSRATGPAAKNLLRQYG